MTNKTPTGEIRLNNTQNLFKHRTNIENLADTSDVVDELITMAKRTQGILRFLCLYFERGSDEIDQAVVCSLEEAILGIQDISELSYRHFEAVLALEVAALEVANV